MATPKRKRKNPDIPDISLPTGEWINAKVRVPKSGDGLDMIVLDKDLGLAELEAAANPKKRTTSHRAMMHRAMMLASAKRSLAQYRADPQHHMLPSEFRRHLVSQYGSGIVNKIWRKSKANPRKRRTRR